MRALRSSGLQIALALMAVSASANSDGAVGPKEDASDSSVKVVVIVDYRSHEPLARLAVEITSEVVERCIKAPCPSRGKQSWQGITDDKGVLHFPAMLDEPDAVVYIHAVGSEFAADVHDETTKDNKGRPVLSLKRPVASANTGSQDRAQCSVNHRPKDFKPPPGTKVATGGFFEIYAHQESEKPAPADYTERVYQVTIVARTTKHGIQRFSERITMLDANLLESASWEVVDLDGDGRDDFRYLAQKTKSGCQVWPAKRWERDRERFTQGGPQLARAVDAHGRKVPNCVLR